MKKLFTVSLVAIMAVSAAHADIASTGYVDGKTGTLAFTANTVKGSANLTAAVEAVASAVESVAGGSIKLTAASAGTNVSIGDDGKINVANANGSTTAGVVKAGDNVTIADGVISVAAPGAGLNADALTGADFVANVSETNGVIEATAGTFQKSIAVDDDTGEATNASETTAPTTAAITGFVESYVDTQMGVLDKSVTGITDILGEGFSGTEGNTVADKLAAAQSAATSAANSYTDGKIEAEVLRANGAYDTKGAAAAAQTAAEATAKAYTDGQIEAEVTRANGAYDAKGAAAAAQTAATTAANSYTDGKIADEVTRADAAYDTKGAAAAAQSAAEAYTDDLLNVPTACEKGAATCALVYDVSTKGLKWEPIIQLN